MRNKSKMALSKNAQKAISVAAIAVFVGLLVIIFYFVGIPLVKFLSEPERFRAWVDSHGFWGRAAFVGIMVLQVFICIIPGEPAEIGAGYAFGALEGTLLCLLGIAVGSSLVFGFVRVFGTRAVEVFFSRDKINSLKYLKDPKRLNFLMFIVFFIPGTPKDLLSYFAGLTKMKYSVFILISVVARIPSVITSTVGGDALGMQNYTFAVIIFAVTLLLTAAGFLIYRRVSNRNDRKQAGYRKNPTNR